MIRPQSNLGRPFVELFPRGIERRVTRIVQIEVGRKAHSSVRIPVFLIVLCRVTSAEPRGNGIRRAGKGYGVALNVLCHRAMLNGEAQELGYPRPVDHAGGSGIARSGCSQL